MDYTYKMSSNSQEFIGVFDSGVGGLSILKRLIKDFPNESFVYLGDTARLPYGAKSKKTIKNYVLKNIGYLHSNYKLKAVVIACNSASSVLKELDLPVKTIGVIESGVLAADKTSKTKNVLLWATRATVLSRAYEGASKKLKTTLAISATPCPTLVALVEEGESSHPLLEPAFDFYLEKSNVHEEIDSLILGCTHFPFFKEALSKFLNKKGLSLSLIDASSEVSIQLKKEITPTLNSSPRLLILVTDEAAHFNNFIHSKMPQNISFEVQKIDI